MYKLLTICALLGLTSAGQLYDPNHTDVTMYTNLNFDKQVVQKRTKGTSIVHFYKSGGK